MEWQRTRSDDLQNVLDSTDVATLCERGKVLIGCRRMAAGLSIQVLDTGVGIQDDQLRPVFDEYYRLDSSPREPGAGLGLSIVQRLGDLLGHPVRVRSVTAKGSVFSVGVRLMPPGKPARSPQPTAAIQRPPPCADDASMVFVVDDDAAVRDAVCTLLAEHGRPSRPYASCDAFFDEFRAAPHQCLLIDAYLPEVGGLEMLRRLRAAGELIPAVMLTGRSDVPMAVAAMRAGASDFIEKPIGGEELLASLQRALDGAGGVTHVARQAGAQAQLETLTNRQREVMALVLDGYPSKNIAADLRISRRTVESHRAAMMRKTGSTSLPALARLALAAASNWRPGVATTTPPPPPGQNPTPAPRRT